MISGKEGAEIRSCLKVVADTQQKQGCSGGKACVIVGLSERALSSECFFKHDWLVITNQNELKQTKKEKGKQEGVGKMFTKRLRQAVSAALAVAMIFGTNVVSAFASAGDLAPGSTYTVPVSMTSAAPLPAVQTAFATALGDSVQVEVDELGNMTAVAHSQQMIIDFMGTYYANIKTFVTEGVEVVSTRQGQSSTTFGNPAAVETITVPDEVRIPLADNSGTYELTVTVDFMDAFLGGGQPYETKVTMTLDLANAVQVIDYSGLESAIGQAQALPEVNYTPETWANLQTALEVAQAALTSGDQTTVDNSLAALKEAIAALEYKGADYTAVNNAIAKIPVDLSIYTDETAQAVRDAQNAVVDGLDISRQDEVNAFAQAIEDAVAALVLKDTTGGNTGTPGGDQNTGNTGNAGNTGNTGAGNTGAGQTVLDKNNLQDGIYEVQAYLWNATSDRASMAADSMKNTTRIVVSNGAATMYIYTQPMTLGTITASLQTLRVENGSGGFADAVVQTRSADGNPTSFSFTLPHREEYINVKVNPMVAMMGNQELDARIKVDYSTLTAVSSTTNLAAQPSGGSGAPSASSPKTGDMAEAGAALWLCMMGAALAVAAVYGKKKGMQR